jgi:asparagine synthase (glutamine-hydrolysing)
MCGIAGWLSFDRQLEDEKEILEVMTASMSFRGPDDAGVWVEGCAALCHRRLAVIDIEGGVQPMTVRTPAGSVALTYSGEVYNFTALRADLIGRGHVFGTRSDTEVVLRGYLEWGESLAERLNGMYAFAIWDARSARLLLVRDRLGVKPLYYYPTQDGVLFGSEPKAILAHPHAARVVDADGLREAFSWARTPGHAVWHGMREVRPGTRVSIGRDGLREHTYWRLEAMPHRDDLDVTVSSVRELLDDIVCRQLVTDVPRCTLLSGGLDSSVITALAQRQLGAAEKIRSFSVDFVGHDSNFAGDRFRDAPDTPFAREVAGRAGTAHENIVLDAAAMADPEVRKAVVMARDLPTGFGDADNSLYLLFRAIREHSTVALSGESADEVFAGYKWFHEPAAQQCETFPWVDHTHVTSPYTGIDVFAEELRSLLDLPGYVRQRHTEAEREIPRLAGESRRNAEMRRVCYLHLTRYVRILLDRKDRLSMAVGLEVRVPFCDHRLVEYVYNTPWDMKTFDGREKSLLRAAAGDLLPESVMRRRKAPYPSTSDPRYVAELQAHVAQIASEPAHPVADLTNREFIRAARRVEPGAMTAAMRTGIERWLDLATWLESCKPTLQLAS